MDQAKTALDNMGEKGLEEVQKRVQGVLAGGDKAGAEGAAGGAGGANPIAGLVSPSVKDVFTRQSALWRLWLMGQGVRG